MREFAVATIACVRILACFALAVASVNALATTLLPPDSAAPNVLDGCQR